MKLSDAVARMGERNKKLSELVGKGEEAGTRAWAAGPASAAVAVLFPGLGLPEDPGPAPHQGWVFNI